MKKEFKMVSLFVLVFACAVLIALCLYVAALIWSVRNLRREIRRQQNEERLAGLVSEVVDRRMAEMAEQQRAMEITANRQQEWFETWQMTAARNRPAPMILIARR
jgi:cell division protein FtsI/penicillin-binding protein 2